MPAYVYGLASRDWFFERRGPHAGRCRLCLFRCDGCAFLATAAFRVLPGRNCGRTRCNNNYHNMLHVDYHSLTKHVQALRLPCKWRFFSELSTTTHGLDLLRARICASQKASLLVDRISILDLIDSRASKLHEAVRKWHCCTVGFPNLVASPDTAIFAFAPLQPSSSHPEELKTYISLLLFSSSFLHCPLCPAPILLSSP